MADLPSIPSMIAAIGALGTASYGLVDTSKALWGGVSNAGFTFIRQSVRALLPENNPTKGGPALLNTSAILAELKGSWLNGTPLTDQRSIAKSLVKLRMNAENARVLAEKAGVDGTVLASVATKMATGEALTPVETDVAGRFDLILTTALNEAYQRADQRYRNWCKLAAIPVSVALAWLGGNAIGVPLSHSLIAGLLATPLAPVAKDLSTAVQAGAKVAQAMKK